MSLCHPNLTKHNLTLVIIVVPERFQNGTYKERAESQAGRRVVLLCGNISPQHSIIITLFNALHKFYQKQQQVNYRTPITKQGAIQVTPIQARKKWKNERFISL